MVHGGEKVATNQFGWSSRGLQASLVRRSMSSGCTPRKMVLSPSQGVLPCTAAFPLVHGFRVRFLRDFSSVFPFSFLFLSSAFFRCHTYYDRNSGTTTSPHLANHPKNDIAVYSYRNTNNPISGKTEKSEKLLLAESSFSFRMTIRCALL